MKVNLKKKYVVTMFFIAIILFLMPNMSKATNTTDFSNAKYTWADDSTSEGYSLLSGYELIITNVNVIEGHKYYYTITSDLQEPTYSSDITGTLRDSSKVEGAMCTKGLADYVELNQDLYLWIWEYSNDDDIEYELVVSGEKLEEPYIPTDYTAFCYNNSLSYNQTWIWLEYNALGSLAGSDRIINIKIGKVSDNDILNDIYNEETDAFSNLLSYAKTSQSIYSGDLEANYYYGYSSFTELFDGVNLLEDDEYYYVYVMLDNEDGKYRTAESVTIAKSSTWLEDFWMLSFLYDGADFDWSSLETTSSESDSNSNSNNSNTNGTTSTTDENDTDNNSNFSSSLSSGKNDDTTSSSSLPYTGVSFAIVIVSIITLAIVVFTYKKMNYYKDIE